MLFSEIQRFSLLDTCKYVPPINYIYIYDNIITILVDGFIWIWILKDDIIIYKKLMIHVFIDYIDGPLIDDFLEIFR